MPFPMKIQPVDSDQAYREPSKPPPVLKSRLKRLFDRPFNSVLKISSTSIEKPALFSGEVKEIAPPPPPAVGALPEFEPSSVCLDRMVQNFIEENTFEKHQPPLQAAQKFGKNNKCNCFNGGGNSSDSSDDEFDFGSFGDSSFPNNNSISSASFGDSIDSLKSLIPCSTTVERNLLADASKIVEKNKSCKRKDDLRKIVTDGLLALGFNASICISKWDKSSSIPAGEYEYIDVIMEEGERVLIDIEFRSEFEIARATGNYKSILQSLPFIFVGNVDRLQQIIAIVSEAAKQSLKKKGMHIPPWRKAEYMKAKWLSSHFRTTHSPQNDVVLLEETEAVAEAEAEAEAENKEVLEESECGEWELIFGEKTTTSEESKTIFSSPVRISGDMTPVFVTWQPPVIKPKSFERGNRVMVTGLASLLKEKS
ncbi:hypothetical protein ACH5RR_033157 [Cinchona calisaya]|uniref:Uncharacterized protein n=1 Tax=Cinchona calisaya TaxID=153742 RepID=A0ABD2YP78_9GENT